MNKWKQALIISVCVSAGSKIFFSVFSEDVNISLDIVLLGVFMYHCDQLSSVKVGFLVGFLVSIWDSVHLVFGGGSYYFIYQPMFFALFFYGFYGTFFYLFYYSNAMQKSEKFWSAKYLGIIFICDFFSSCLTTMARSGDLREFKLILAIAAVRSVLVLMIIFCVHLYNRLFDEVEEEEKNNELTIMASVFRSEVYFMKKNMVEIEDITKKVFTLYREMQSEGLPRGLEESALDIAKDIHEIKKDYVWTIKGLQENFLAELNTMGMSLNAVIYILKMDIDEQIQARNLDIVFTVKLRGDFTIQDHFSLMSILRNLILNSIDAVGEKRYGSVHLAVFPGEGDDSDYYFFNITDNGTGIGESDIDVIFDPGYSTKFDDETGDINRGIGLTLVRDLIYDKFGGNMYLESRLGFYARFQIKLLKRMLEGCAE